MIINRREFLEWSAWSAAAAAAVSWRVPASHADDSPDYADTGVGLLRRITPAADGFYFPGEWAEHELTVMVMPPPQNWRGNGFTMREVRGQWGDMVKSCGSVMIRRPFVFRRR